MTKLFGVNHHQGYNKVFKNQLRYKVLLQTFCYKLGLFLLQMT